jgi:hypothetical protein
MRLVFPLKLCLCRVIMMHRSAITGRVRTQRHPTFTFSTPTFLCMVHSTTALSSCGPWSWSGEVGLAHSVVAQFNTMPWIAPVLSDLDDAEGRIKFPGRLPMEMRTFEIMVRVISPSAAQCAQPSDGCFHVYFLFASLLGMFVPSVVSGWIPLWRRPP